MAVFISYSHSDKEFVDKLAIGLVKARAQVWLDRWELNVGDSLTQKIQAALQDASALLVVLSPASIASEWFKRELTAGLVRELEERRVVVLPILLENCEIPLFLRDKVYADFRTDFRSGLKEVLKAIAKVTNTWRSRIESPKWYNDWAMDWGIDSIGLRVVLTFVEHAIDRPYSVQTIVTAFGDTAATKQFLAHARAKLDWLFADMTAEKMAQAIEKQDMRMVLGNNNPHTHSFRIEDKKARMSFEVRVECRLLGEDTGSDVLVDISNLLREARQHMGRTARAPKAEELERLTELLRELDG